MNRGRFLMSTLGLGTLTVGGPWLTAATAASEEELAFANFGASAEYLLKDFYTKAIEAKVVSRAQLATLKRGRSAASQHVRSLSQLLVDAGDVAPSEEDFQFVWPAKTFRSEKEIVTTGLLVLRSLLGAYQTAGAAVTDQAYRVLYASLGASVSQQIGALAARSGRGAVEPFPAAMDLEAATNVLEPYLG